MIDYLYGKFPTLRGAEEICEIFEIVDLAERFKVCSCLCIVFVLSEKPRFFPKCQPSQVLIPFPQRWLAWRTSIGQLCSSTSGITREIDLRQNKYKEDDAHS